MSNIPDSPPAPRMQRLLPVSDIEFLSSTTEPGWGKASEIPQELNAKLNTLKIYEDKEGNKYHDKKEYWDLLGYYTRDMRLANLNGNELEYCVYYLDLAGDLLREGFVQTFLACLARVITQLELSQSKNGFFRKRMGTLTTENKHSIDEPKKTNLFGSKRNS
jgi:hypothetical protein